MATPRPGDAVLAAVSHERLAARPAGRGLGASLLALALLAASWGARPQDAAWLDEVSAAYARGEYAAALTLVQPLAHAGNPRAQTIVAMMYRFGEGVAQDDAAAASWYARAARQGYAAAQLALGDLYAAGRGVPRDPGQARAWWSRAAAQGHARALARLQPTVTGPTARPSPESGGRAGFGSACAPVRLRLAREAPAPGPGAMPGQPSPEPAAGPLRLAMTVWPVAVLRWQGRAPAGEPVPPGAAPFGEGPGPYCLAGQAAR